MIPADDPGWTAYADAILVFHTVPPFEIDLSRPISPDRRALLAGAGLGGEFGLVTAENPRGRAATPDRNRRLRAAFDAELSRHGGARLRVDGLSRDRRHCEIGVALDWPKQSVVELARRWEQSAIYWFDGAVMWVIGALTDAPPWKLEPR
ncbi:MAG TPA: DUF3293 domain-containing protein [Gemmatimonadales bacterium]|nr:DUF3293 domain-containing protein [Gemmatimonadales bacterium]